MTFDPHSRHLQRHYRCEGCDMPIAPNETLCEECSRADLDREMEEEDQ